MTVADSVPKTDEVAITPASAWTRPSENVPLGIFYMVLATMAFAVMHALGKWLIASYPIGQVMFSRSIVGLLVCSAFVLPRHGLSVFTTQKTGAHVMRGVSQSFSQTFSVLAFSLMPLAGAVAINFSAPLWAALVAMLWLKERAGLVRWAVLFVGFLGVVIVADPGANMLALGAVFALLNAIMVGTVTAAVRGMTGTEKAETLLMWQLATVSALHLPLLVFGFHWATPRDFALFFLSGIANLIAQYCWTKALVLAPTTAVSPFFYFMLLWVTAIAYLVWGEIPTIHLIIGSCIVVAAGLYLLWHETKQRRVAKAT